jgi:hypothetical protein
MCVLPVLLGSTIFEFDTNQGKASLAPPTVLTQTAADERKAKAAAAKANAEKAKQKAETKKRDDAKKAAAARAKTQNAAALERAKALREQEKVKAEATAEYWCRVLRRVHPDGATDRGRETDGRERRLGFQKKGKQA